MMTKRSSHMPMFTDMQTMNSSGRLRRVRSNHTS